MQSPGLSDTPSRPPGPPCAEAPSLPGGHRSPLSRPGPSGRDGLLAPSPSAAQVSSPPQRPGKQNPETTPESKGGRGCVSGARARSPGWERARVSREISGPGMVVDGERPWRPGPREQHPGLARQQALGGKSEVCASGLYGVGVGAWARRGTLGEVWLKSKPEMGDCDPVPEQVVLLVGSGSLALCGAQLRPGSQEAFRGKWASRGRPGVRSPFQSLRLAVGFARSRHHQDMTGATGQGLPIPASAAPLFNK